MRSFPIHASRRISAIAAMLGAMMVLGTPGANAAPPEPLDPHRAADEASPTPKPAQRTDTRTVWTLQCAKLPVQTFTSANVTVGKNVSMTLVQTFGRDQTMEGWADEAVRGGKLVHRDCTLTFGTSEQYVVIGAIVDSSKFAGPAVTYGVSAASVTKAVIKRGM
jgi:hypothetical protein